LRGCYAFGVFLPSIFVQFTHQVTGLGRKNREWVISAYSISTMLLPFVFTDLFIKRLQIIQPYHFRISEPGPVYYLFLIFFSVTVYRVLFLMYQAVKNAIGEKRKQLQSILVAHAVAVAAGFDYFASVLGFVKSLGSQSHWGQVLK
ncbi:MAG: hypothetical protein HYS07_03005, partial [Chlamydiae bacterium]|nr:hypothetical protein [Chlamydiota bacterium]